jgi:hypothetical protein
MREATMQRKHAIAGLGGILVEQQECEEDGLGILEGLI